MSIIMKRGTDPDSVRRAVAAKVPGSIVQTVRGDAATNGFCIEMIAAQTLRANGTQNMLARRPEVDLLLRLAGTTQISRAIDQMGAKKGMPFLLVVAGPRKELDSLSLKDLGGVELGSRGLSYDELRIIERAALLNAQNP
jgi:tRNA threonylcarbamoyladenosine modification (KEOPS) complex Cgi121 subunit